MIYEMPGFYEYIGELIAKEIIIHMPISIGKKEYLMRHFHRNKLRFMENSLIKIIDQNPFHKFEIMCDLMAGEFIAILDVSSRMRDKIRRSYERYRTTIINHVMRNSLSIKLDGDGGETNGKSG